MPLIRPLPHFNPSGIPACECREAPLKGEAAPGWGLLKTKLLYSLAGLGRVLAEARLKTETRAAGGARHGFVIFTELPPLFLLL